MSDKLIVSTRKGLFIFDRSENGWAISRKSFLGDPVTLCLSRQGGQSLLAALDLGHFGVKIQKSDDGGKTWQEKPAPTFPPKPDDLEEVEPVQQKPVPWSLKKVWAFAEASGRIWCGTIPGGLFSSDDDGESWALNEALWFHEDRPKWFGGGADYPGIHSIIVDPRDPSHITVGVSCGGVWKSKDNGQSWTSSAKGMRAEYMPPDQAFAEVSQDPHMIVQCPSAPDVLWCQHHNGIFLSKDNGANWEEITDVEPSVFGFGAAVHPTQPDCAWFVPGIKDEERYPKDGKLLVNRTRDGGKTFEKLTEGLPKEDSYDIIYRHALAIDNTGERLAMGSTTGNLWLTENGGDSWFNVSHYLPPIYAVAFA